MISIPGFFALMYVPSVLVGQAAFILVALAFCRLWKGVNQPPADIPFGPKR